MRKKLALVLAATLAFSAFAVGCGSDEEETTTKAAATKAPATTTEATTEAPAAEVETLKSEAWWSGTGIGKDYALEGDGSVTVVVKQTDGAETGAFSVELYSKTDAAGYYFTTGSDGNAWRAEMLEGECKNPFADNNGADPGKYVPGNTYEVTITRAGNDYTAKYVDVASGEVVYEMTLAATTEAPATMNVHVMAQVGTFEVSQK